MIIPPGVKFYTGRKEYREGAELPANAPEQVKKLCSERAAELSKKEKGAKPTTISSRDEGGGN